MNQSSVPARSRIVIPVIIFLAALIPRVAFLFDYRGAEQFPVDRYSDSFYYYLWAQDLFCADSMGARVFMKWPLYAYVLGIVLKIARNDVLTVYILQAILGAAHCALVYIIGKRLFSPAAGAIAAALCVCYGMFTFYDGLMMYVTLSLVLNAVFFLYLLRLKESLSPARLFCAGMLLGFCTLAQGNVLLFGVPALIFIAAGKSAASRPRLLNAAWAVAGMLLVIGPVTARNYAVGRDFVPIAGNLGINFFIGNNPAANGEFLPPENLTWNQEGMFRDAKAIARWETQRRLKPSEVSRYWAAQAGDFISRRPGEFLKLTLQKILSAFAIREPVHDIEYQGLKDRIRVFRVLPMSPWLILPLGLFGMALFARSARSRWPLYLFVITQAASLIIFFVTTRYRMTYMSHLAVFAGAGVCWLWQRLKAREVRTFIRAAAALILLWCLLAVEWPTAAVRRRTAAQQRANITYASDGFRSLQRGDYAAAVRLAGFARAAKPEHYAGMLLRAHALMNAGRKWEAELALRETINAFPYCVHARYFLAALLNNEGRFAEARVQAGGALFLDEDFSDAHYELGRAWQGLGDRADARDAWQTAHRLTNCYYANDRRMIADALKAL